MATTPVKRPSSSGTIKRKGKPTLRSKGGKGRFKSTMAKKLASRDRVKNPRAKKALAKRHPRTPTYYDRAVPHTK